MQIEYTSFQVDVKAVRDDRHPYYHCWLRYILHQTNFGHLYKLLRPQYFRLEIEDSDNDGFIVKSSKVCSILSFILQFAKITFPNWYYLSFVKKSDELYVI